MLEKLKSDSGAEELPHSLLPVHVAIIMDGNGRWAKDRGLPRTEGHRQGAKTVRMVVEECRKAGVRYLTLFAFSTENWFRPKEEVSVLMSLFARYLESELMSLAKNGVRLRVIGDLDRLPKVILERLEKAMAGTAHNTELDLVLAVSYGGRDEIVRAASKIAADSLSGKLDPATLNESSFRAYLDAPDIPDPDLLIRTGDEYRISNFLLWQLAYSEIVVSKQRWPEFTAAEFAACLKEFASRTRRFGRTEAVSKAAFEESPVSTGAHELTEDEVSSEVVSNATQV